MMRHNRRVKHFIPLAGLVAMAVFAAPALAQDQNPFVPTSAWLVGPASLAANIGNISSKIPCVVANQYNNGAVLRFSGGDNKLMALAIDVKQKSFKPRQKYDVELSVPGQFFQVVSGAAFDESTLIFNLQKIPDLYAVLKEAEVMNVKIGDTTLPLALIGLDDGFERMEICYNPSIHGPAPMAPPVAPNPVAPPTTGVTMVGTVPEGSRTATPQNPLIAREAGALTPMMDDAQAALPQGAPQGAAAPDLIAMASEAEDAARSLAARSPQNNRPAAPSAAAPAPAPQGEQLAEGWTDARQVRAGTATDVMAQPPGKEVYVRREMRWRALKGANLREVLGVWAEGSGARLIWNSSRDFAVQRSLSLQGTFESATQGLLEQYNDSNPRPVGRIYREPGTSKLVLVVELSDAR
ncbi:MAG: TcpQ domain-containing protein [Micavibrio aeruginosavorus]|nr:TcpQ domain-containing protein [Micavibrio aeruginosavorus]